MVAINHLVFIEPERHYLVWSSCVMREIVEAGGIPEYVVRELRAGEAMPDTINAAIAELDPALVWGVGHGNTDTYTVECVTRYMTMCDENTARMRGRVVHLNSCLTARALGPDLMGKGAVAYFGSRDPFWFYIGSPACSDRASRAVFLAEHQVEVSLLAGRNTGQARADQLARYDDEIEYWTTGPGRDHPHAAIIVRILQIDKAISVMMGSPDVVVCAPPTPMPLGILVLTLGMAPVGAVVAAVGTEELKKLKVIP